MNLYEINEEIQNCMRNLVDPETGEVIGEEVDFDYLDQLQMEKSERIENIACWIKDLKAEGKAIREEEKTLAKRRKAAENKAESLTEYIKTALEGQKFKTSKVSISYRKSDTVEVYDYNAIPEEFLKYAEPTINKELIKKQLKAGEEIEGAELLQHSNIQIR